MAGTGKSTISRTVAQALFEKGRLGASFFFKRGDGDRGNTSKVFTTLAAQLVAKEPATAVHMQNAIDSGVIGKTLGEQFEKLILAPLSKSNIALQSTALVIVLDALDECDGTDDKIIRIIHILFRANKLHPAYLKVLITSRPELRIRCGFNTAEQKYDGIILHEIPEDVVERDIRAYLGLELAGIKTRYNATASSDAKLPLDWPAPSDLDTIVAMAVPLFIFAATVCRFLEDRRGGNPSRQLTKVMAYKSSSQASKFGATYFPVLDQLIDGCSVTETTELICHFQAIVGAIVLLASPLSARSLANMLTLPFDTIRDLLDLLHSVLSVPSSSDSPIRLLHLSFRDFLVHSDNRWRQYNHHSRQPNPFWVDEKETHVQLAAHCLRLMRDRLRYDMCDLDGIDGPGTRRTAIDPSHIAKALPPELQYACRYWIHHTIQAGVYLRDNDDTHRFLGDHLLHWLEALSLMGRVSSY